MAVEIADSIVGPAFTVGVGGTITFVAYLFKQVTTQAQLNQRSTETLDRLEKKHDVLRSDHDALARRFEDAEKAAATRRIKELELELAQAKGLE